MVSVCGGELYSPNPEYIIIKGGILCIHQKQDPIRKTMKTPRNKVLKQKKKQKNKKNTIFVKCENMCEKKY